MSANGISTLATKQLRQVAKLDLAATDRTAVGNPRSIYDITQLPTKYVDDDIYDNPNLAEFTLTPGVIRTNVSKVTYSGYHTDDVNFTDSATVTASTTANNFVIASIAENTTVLYTGYLLASYTGTWTFTITSDDASYLWIGNTAVLGYATGNALASASYAGPVTGTISLTAGEYYPIRLLYGNGPASGNLNLTYAYTGQTATNNFTGKLFSPGVSLVVGRPWIGIGMDDPANSAEPNATAWVLMDGPYGDGGGFYGGISWRKMAPIGYFPYGKETYQYFDETVRWNGATWLYENVGLGIIATGAGGDYPWQAIWTGSYRGAKITSAYVKTTNYPAVP